MRNSLILLILLAVASLQSQELPFEITFFNLPAKIKEVKRSALSIETIAINADINKTKPSMLGSGFLVIKSGKHYAVTNDHVIRNIRKENHLLIGLNTKQGKIYNLANLIKSDSQKDIAIIALSDSFIGTGAIDTTQLLLDQAAIGVSVSGDSADTIEGAGVILIGFPLGLGTELTGNQAISRIGIVAQSPRPNGYFLVDATASHGNSGSPVFNLQSGKLIGMIVGSPSDRISAFDENGVIIASLPYNSGLSLCISAREIFILIP